MDAEDPADDGQGGDGDDEDEPLIPDEITDEYFETLVTKTNSLIKELQIEQKFGLVEEFQRILGVSQIIKRDLANEKLRIKEVESEVVAAENRIEVATQKSLDDQECINRLKTEIENAWKQRDTALTREQSAQEAMMILREKLEKLQKECEKQTEKKDGADEMGSHLGKHKENILRERDRLNTEVMELNRRLQIQRSYTEEIEKKRQEAEKKLKEMYKVLDATSDEAFREKKLIQLYKIQVAELTADRDSKEEAMRHFKTQTETCQKQMVQLNIYLSSAKSTIEKINTQYRSVSDKLTKTQTELDNTISLKAKLTHELSQKNNFLKLREDENRKYVAEIQTLIKSREMLMKKIMIVEIGKSGVDQDLIKCKNLILTFEKERDASKKNMDMMKKDIEKVIKEREIVRKDLQKANRVIGSQSDAIILQEQQTKTLENEIRGHMATEQKLKTQVIKIEKERDRNAEESQAMSDKNELINDDLTQKIIHITELKEKISDLQTKVSQIQQLYETARNERNGFQKDLQECILERDSIKDQLKLSTHQYEKLKVDIEVKETELNRLEKLIEKLEREKQALKIDNQNILTALQHTKTELREKNVENERLCKTFNEERERISKLRKDLDTALNDKDLIGTQLIRRNDEIGLLNERNNIIQMALDRGETQYNKRLDDIRLLKIEIANLRSQRNLLTRGLSNTADMRQEVLQLNRDLTQERVKSKALEQEITTPMNIHRWRKLEGEDPDKMDLIIKVQTLQKRLLAQTVQATEREQTLEETQKMYASLKDLILKLPAYEIKERLNNTQRVLTAKTKKLKALAAEINIKQLDEKAKEITIEKLKTSLVETKRELSKQKKEKSKILEQLEKEASVRHFSPVLPPGSPGYRTMGAGFKINS